MTIVTSTYRYKRPPRKRKAVALDVPRVTTIRRAPVPPRRGGAAATSCRAEIPETRPVIVTAKNPHRGRFGDVPDMTPEEHEQRGDAAVALFRELVRRARGE